MTAQEIITAIEEQNWNALALEIFYGGSVDVAEKILELSFKEGQVTQAKKALETIEKLREEKTE